jgi:DNA-binding response OmpR family regulator
MHLSTILAFGHDTTLLRTRELILRHDGFDVVTATERSEASRLLAEQPVDLLILCHTLREQERESILSLAHASQRHLKTLVLVTTDYAFTSCQDATLCTFDGPPTLLAAVHQLTSQPVH